MDLKKNKEAINSTLRQGEFIDKLHIAELQGICQAYLGRKGILEKTDQQRAKARARKHLPETLLAM